MSRGRRCWGCCQENCGYDGCGCSCHNRRDVLSDPLREISQRFADAREREMAELLAQLPPTVVVDDVRWDRAIEFSDGCESRCGCFNHPGRYLQKLRDGRSAVHVVECKGCSASWCVGRP